MHLLHSCGLLRRSCRSCRLGRSGGLLYRCGLGHRLCRDLHWGSCRSLRRGGGRLRVLVLIVHVYIR
jgi:hypothetical protein